MENGQVSRSRRRTRSEVEQLVAEYEGSGLRRTEFCRTHGLSLSTLNRYCKRRQVQSEAAGVDRWVAVELAGSRFGSSAGGTAGLTVILNSGRRIEIARGFDADTLHRLIERLERA